MDVTSSMLGLKLILVSKIPALVACKVVREQGNGCTYQWHMKLPRKKHRYQIQTRMFPWLKDVATTQVCLMIFHVVHLLALS